MFTLKKAGGDSPWRNGSLEEEEEEEEETISSLHNGQCSVTDSNWTDFLLWRPSTSGLAPNPDPLGRVSDAQRVACTFSVHECRSLWFKDKTAGVINFSNLLVNPHPDRQSYRKCFWTLNVPRGHYIIATVDKVDTGPSVNIRFQGGLGGFEHIYPYLGFRHYKGPEHSERERPFTLPVFLSTTNQLRFYHFHTNSYLIDDYPNATALYNIRFQTTAERPTHLVRKELTSPVSGTITHLGYDNNKGYADNTDASFEFSVPKGKSLVLSFPLFYLKGASQNSCGDYLELRTVSPNGIQRVSWRQCGRQIIPVEVFLHRVALRFLARREKESRFIQIRAGFQLQFSFHPLLQSPRRLSSGRFDCSVPYYHTFKHHVLCNGVHECHHSEDESPHLCPFTCVGSNHSFTVGRKCYNLTRSSLDYGLTQDEAEEQCRSRGGALAMLKTRSDWRGFYSFLSSPAAQQVQLGDSILLGLWTSVPTESKIYRYVWKWRDGTIWYEANITGGTLYPRATYSLHYVVEKPLHFGVQMAPYVWLDNLGVHPTFYDIKHTHILCQFGGELNYAKKTEQPQIIPTTDFMVKRVKLGTFVQCPSGHLTFDFLSCDAASHCGAQPRQKWCTFQTAHTLSRDGVLLFVCDDQKTTVPYTLLCNFREDCKDGSDEGFCVHSKHCRGFLCTNLQCIAQDRHNDNVNDCNDGSDEWKAGQSYNWLDVLIPNSTTLPVPHIINIEGFTQYSQTPLQHGEDCPETHFRCAEGLGSCLPVFVLCNGVYDCPGREDEAACQDFACPGFYRCRDSSVCLHHSQLCDDVPQCPQGEDEGLCDVACPGECRCQGLAFVCPQPFPAERSPRLRYLDAAGSSLKPGRMAENRYLSWLSLASCRLDSLPLMELPNLRVLDLSHNQLVTLRVDSVLTLNNLRVLRLAGNPLVSFHSGQADAVHENLQVLDLSATGFLSFDSGNLSMFYAVSSVNLSSSRLKVLSAKSFLSLKSLKVLDIRAAPVVEYPRGIFLRLSGLTTVYTDNFKLCCRQNLPDNFNPKFCFAPRDEVSSCEDLLRSNVYRYCLWVICLMSVGGNATCLFFRLFVQKNATKSGFNLFVVNLSAADLLMGLYLAVIGSADLTYRGQYLWFEAAWKGSAMCRAAGFLLLLSSETSIFVICLITLDRLLAIRFPFLNLRFNVKSAAIACALTWVLNFLLGLIPLLPSTAHWKFYEQSGICFPLPITRKTFKGWEYSFGIMIVFNFTLFLVIAVGQTLIYLSIRRNSMEGISTTKKSQDLIIARRLLSVVLSDFMCWFPVGLLGLLAARGTPIPGEANVAMAIFFVPLNSALNPFLYTFNMVMEKRRKKNDTRLLAELEARIRSQHSGRECVNETDSSKMSAEGESVNTKASSKMSVADDSVNMTGKGHMSVENECVNKTGNTQACVEDECTTMITRRREHALQSLRHWLEITCGGCDAIGQFLTRNKEV